MGTHVTQDIHTAIAKIICQLEATIVHLKNKYEKDDSIQSFLNVVSKSLKIWQQTCDILYCTSNNSEVLMPILGQLREISDELNSQFNIEFFMNCDKLILENQMKIDSLKSLFEKTSDTKMKFVFEEVVEYFKSSKEEIKEYMMDKSTNSESVLLFQLKAAISILKQIEILHTSYGLLPAMNRHNT